MAGAGCPRLLQLSRSADQRSGTECVPASCDRPLATHAAASQPEGSDDVGTDDAAGGCLASKTDYPPSLAERSLCCHTPEVGAVCAKAARTVLCGGRAMKRASLPLQRREILKAALGFTSIAVTNASGAQTRGPKREGYLSGASRGLREITIDILEERLRALGWRAGETIEFELRWADGDFSRLPTLASELVMLRPDVIVATGSSETTSLHAATREMPVVFIQVLDPLSLGVITSIARPGG